MRAGSSVTFLFALLNKREKKQLVLVFFALLLMGFIELAGVGSIGPFISVASNPGIIHSNKYLSMLYERLNCANDASFIIICGVAVIAVLCASNISLAAINFVIYYYSGKRQHSIAMRFLEKYLRQPYLFYLNTNTANLSKKILDEINTYVQKILISSLNLISAAVISVFIIVLLIILNPLLAAAVSAVLAVSYCLIFFTIRKFLSRKGRERSMYNTLKFKCISETFGGIKDIKILGKEKVFISRFQDPSLKFAMNNAMSDMVGEIPKFLMETIAISGIIAVILVMIHGGSQMDQFLPLLTIYAFGAYRLLPLMQKMYRAVSNIKYHQKVFEDLYNDFCGLPPGNPLSDSTIPALPFTRSIKLDRVSFSYPNTERDVIKEQSLVIKHNTSIALVGATGCGKTTLADIILGLLEPQKGKLFIDDVEIGPDNIKAWQKNLGYVPQSIYLTDDTVRNNIAFGIESGKIDDAAVENAARMANIHHFIVNDLKDGYGTMIGERGIRLSGGQRQRIGIARAIYHDPSVLILDEATSALDSLTESAIMDAIANLNSKKTIVMIAHRLTTVKSCDVIYMMDKGVIVDAGNYGELYASNAVFKKLADGK